MSRRTHTHLVTHVYIHKHTHSVMHVCIHKHTHSVTHVCIQKRTHTHIRVYIPYIHMYSRTYTHMHNSIYVRIYTHMHSSSLSTVRLSVLEEPLKIGNNLNRNVLIETHFSPLTPTIQTDSHSFTHPGFSIII